MEESKFAQKQAVVDQLFDAAQVYLATIDKNDRRDRRCAFDLLCAIHSILVGAIDVEFIRTYQPSKEELLVVDRLLKQLTPILDKMRKSSM